MNFRSGDTIAGYARDAVDLRIRMADHFRTDLARRYLRAYLDTGAEHRPDDAPPVTAEAVAAMMRITGGPWSNGEPYVCAPAMTAIVAAAADALDLTGEVLPDDIAPSDFGVLFLPEPIYQRNPFGEVTSVGAVTWARVTTPTNGRSSWCIGGWADRHDPHDPAAARRAAVLAGHPGTLAQLGPYVLTDFAELAIGEPVTGRPGTAAAARARDWESAPDGRYCITETAGQSPISARIAYAFWRIQAQPLAHTAPAAPDRHARRRAARASLVHQTRVVMLRRTSTAAERGGSEPRWHYRVRFLVRGHWRRLTDRDGRPYRIWINAHIKGPDGAPLLLGETVSVLGR
ncbi:hypothetical protein GCM10010123_19770 [Pilimelia anulata]|uniref:Uncharacterized protein n=1 Tax=Pilimelia anulata TaxID=53371 RepID=A0A8J3B9L1_9ACTN|nr:hypothetical protein [Pilimelia anulata]GGJ89988.1 hypothetical protein GCM10010123_19770 [Pilimelia anulata]